MDGNSKDQGGDDRGGVDGKAASSGRVTRSSLKTVTIEEQEDVEEGVDDEIEEVRAPSKKSGPGKVSISN
jgi:hypothetical protein